MYRALVGLVVIITAASAAGQGKKEFKWELDAVGILNTTPKASPKMSSGIVDHFAVKEIISDDRVLVESERRWTETDRSSSGIGFAVKVTKRAALHKPFVLKGPPTAGLKKKETVKVEGEYKVVGTMKHGGETYFVVEPQEKK